ncbi:acyl-CoA desaturase [Kineosporia mesophila]|uniref:Acyl-CoA desaturase n=1 Tax=Kineosporia mesophila TaxID=566012 RepID=A0ABP6ZB80_9ACTN|nr:acyl-CoA desaturase [Kineosporia mesophila]
MSNLETRPARVRQVSSYAELSRQIRDAGLLRRRYAYYWSWGIGLVMAFLACWTAVLMLGNTWCQLLVAGLLGVVVTQFGFLGHDAAHRQIFDSSRWNEWAARVLSGVFAGLSYGWWLHKHNRHHSGPNQENRDPDIAPGPIAMTPAVARARTGWAAWFTRHQGHLFFPLLLLEGANLHVGGVRELISNRALPHRRLECTIILTRFALYLGVLLSVLPPGKALAFIAVQLGVFGFLLGASFAPNHKGMPIVPKDTRIDFLQRQVLMSRNVHGGPVTDIAMGGLNYQIEHHLFPSMPRPNLRRARPMVREFCRSRQVTYTETSLIGSYRIVVRYLNTVGRPDRDPFACPLVRQYRG